MMEFLTQFHFLRPALLLLAPALLALLFLMRHRRNGQNSWQTLLPPEFLAALSETPPQTVKRSSFWLWPLILVLSVVALAGPTWSKQETPVTLKQEALVVTLDLSLSMLATDLTPNRLTRARQKVYDLLDARKEGQTALVAFSGSGHVVAPLTEDGNTLRAMLPALDPFIMPEMGSNAAAGIESALNVIKQAGAANARILLITDGVEEMDVQPINDQLSKAGVSISVLGVGADDGGPIPIPNRGFIKQGDQVIVAKPDFALMREIAGRPGDRFSKMTLDNADLRRLLPSANSTHFKDANGDSTLQGEQWHDAGYLLLLIVMPLLLWQYRQAGVALCLLVLLAKPQVSHAVEWENLWSTPNQRGWEFYKDKKYEDAANAYSSPMGKGAAYFRTGDYAKAEAEFGKLDSANAHYNRGNSLAYQQRYEEAIKAYEEALKRNPEMSDAKENKRRLEEFLEQQKQQQQQQQQQQQNSQDQNKDQQQPDQKNADQQQSQQQNSSDSQKNQSNSQPQNGQPSDQDNAGQPGQQGGDPGQHPQDQNADKQNSSSAQDAQEQQNAEQAQSGDKEDQADPKDAASKAASAEQQEADKKEDGKEAQTAGQAGEPEDASDKKPSEDAAAALSDNISLKDQQTEQWLRRIPDDPGGLLRRKFLQQYQQGSRPSSSKQDSGRPLW
ncbi:VWA domain-containing protein [Hahella sp. KA22]|uniref:VWA domain-containing protein n=1 Tax=Hahella sp. KA22 TaxID=1628392 RepID=UPI000FDD66E1|nr:VWA domain-containing protein [Hahella sp. KA22]AZZ91322.1 VWA domain-containing protein [Hahella sp. KA22]QAY54691.1 VWA domain-containing protein [Hahella sp. KA22]